MTSGTMKAVRIHRYGPPECLIYEDVPIPQAGPGQVLVRNEAAGINFADIDQRRNNYPFQPALPHLLGGRSSPALSRPSATVSQAQRSATEYSASSPERSRPHTHSTSSRRQKRCAHCLPDSGTQRAPHCWFKESPPTSCFVTECGSLPASRC